MIIDIQYPGDKYQNYNDYIKKLVALRVKRFVGLKKRFEMDWITPNHIKLDVDPEKKLDRLIQCLEDTFCKAKIRILK